MDSGDCQEVSIAKLEWCGVHEAEIEEHLGALTPVT